jgi:hypothetical protein
LSDTEVLFELHAQAIAAGLSDDSEASLIAFFALAERARSRGNKPQALFIWLLQNRKFEFITQADEDAAMRRIKEHRCPSQPRAGDPTREPANQNGFNEDDRVVKICHDIARKNRIADPFIIARRTKHWTRDHWDQARENFELRFGLLG